MPVLDYSVNNAADGVAVAAYVVAISSSGCCNFLHVILSMRWGVATWVPFFDNGKCLTKGRVRASIDEFRSGCHHFSSAHFGV